MLSLGLLHGCPSCWLWFPASYKKSEKSYKIVTGTSYTILSLPSSPEFAPAGGGHLFPWHILLFFRDIFGTAAHFVGAPAKAPKFTRFFRPFAHAS